MNCKKCKYYNIATVHYIFDAGEYVKSGKTEEHQENECHRFPQSVKLSQDRMQSGCGEYKYSPFMV